MRPTAFALITLAAASLLSGCVYFADADREIAALREFAGGLDGVTTVEELSNGPANVASPFSIDAEAVVLITVEGDDWRETVPSVAAAVIDWLDTEQTNQSVDLGAGVAFPGGVIGLADPDATTARFTLAEAFATDARVTSSAIGWEGESPSGSEESAPVVVERIPEATVSEIAADWMPALGGFGPLSVRVAFSSADDGSAASRVDTTTLGQRSVVFDGAPSDLTAYLGWIDGVDAMADVQGWRASSTAVTVAVRPEASLIETETAVRALPGFDQAGSLTLVYGELTVASDGTVTTARSIAELLADDPRFTEIAPGQGELAATVSDLGAARDLVDLAETIADSATLPLTLRIRETDTPLQFTDVPVGGAHAWIAMLGSVPDDIGVENVRVFGADDVEVALAGTYDSARVLAVFEAIHDQAISAAVAVNLQFDDSDEFFIAQFDAVPTISAADLWVGRNTERTRDHDDLVALWNSLG